MAVVVAVAVTAAVALAVAVAAAVDVTAAVALAVAVAVTVALAVKVTVADTRAIMLPCHLNQGDMRLCKKLLQRNGHLQPGENFPEIRDFHRIRDFLNVQTSG